jgi:hypothetical protein
MLEAIEVLEVNLESRQEMPKTIYSKTNQMDATVLFVNSIHHEMSHLETSLRETNHLVAVVLLVNDSLLLFHIEGKAIENLLAIKCLECK